MIPTGLARKELDDLYSDHCCALPDLDDEFTDWFSWEDALSFSRKVYKGAFDDGSFDSKSVHEYAQKFNKAVEKGWKKAGGTVSFDFDSPDTKMLEALRDNVYHFSAAKNREEILQMSALLRDEKGKLRTWNSFKEEAVKVTKDFKERYMRVEYDLAVNSAYLAARWQDYDDEDILEYQTAGDQRVRDSHRAMDGIALPKSHPFWDRFYPPNGWNCRCTVVVSQSGRITPENKAFGDTENVPPMFRSNFAKEGFAFPEGHPYFRNEVSVNRDYEILRKAEIFSRNIELMTNEMKNGYPGIDIEKINAVNMYTSYYYYDINSFNRGNIDNVEFVPKYGITDEFYQSLTRTINKALDEIPDKYSGTTYRGAELNRKQVEAYMNAFKMSNPVKELGFTSTSYDKTESFDGNVTFNIQSKTGTMIEKVSDKPNEKEVLFKAGQEFRVTKIDEFDGDVWHIYLEEI